MLGREAAVERTGVSHPNVVCLPAVSEGHSKNPGECCSLWVEELVVSAARQEKLGLRAARLLAQLLSLGQ